MQISKNIYQLSGVAFETNSNCYVINAGDQLVLIDAGFSEKQYIIIKKSLKDWGLGNLPITHTFFTHCHYDHAGNAALVKKDGSKILVAKDDAEAMETGDERTIGHMFGGLVFTPCAIDTILADGDTYTIGNCTIEAIHMPGHTKGSMMFQVVDEGQKYLFLGDFISIGPVELKDDVSISLAWTGSPDYSKEDFMSSIKRAATLEPAVLLPGHYYAYFGDSQELFRKAWDLALVEL